jgi:hypothetical protein
MIDVSRTLSLAAACALAGGCATPPASPGQRIEVRVEADDPRWSGPLACEASNPEGTWRFDAPGTVEVRPSSVPLRITCEPQAGTSIEPSVSPSSAVQAGARQGAGVGTAIGIVAGVAAGVAAAPIAGTALAVLLAVGATAKGYEIGTVVGAASGTVASTGRPGYPSPIVLRVHVQAPAPASGDGAARPGAAPTSDVQTR